MIYFNNRNGSSGLTCKLIPRLISATAIYGRWNSSLCWKGRWYPTETKQISSHVRVICLSRTPSTTKSLYCQIYLFSRYKTMWQYTAGRSLLSQPPKPLMAIQSSSGFPRLRPGVFHISWRTHKTQHTQPRGWKKKQTNNRGLGLAPNARRKKFITL